VSVGGGGEGFGESSQSGTTACGVVLTMASPVIMVPEVNEHVTDTRVLLKKRLTREFTSACTTTHMPGFGVRRGVGRGG
jgi:hypothetical protein